MQRCHSLRCKQIDMSTVNQLISTFPNNEECLIQESFNQCSLRQHMHMYKQSKLVERLKVWLCIWTLNARSQRLLKTCTRWSSKLTGGLLVVSLLLVILTSEHLNESLSKPVKLWIKRKLGQNYWKHKQLNWSFHNIQRKRSWAQAQQNALRRLLEW